MVTVTRPRGLAPLLMFVVGLLALAAAPATAAPAARPVTSAAVLATEEWNWDAFCKFWKRQGGKTSGVVGIVALVGLGATLIILSKGRG